MGREPEEKWMGEGQRGGVGMGLRGEQERETAFGEVKENNRRNRDGEGNIQ